VVLNSGVNSNYAKVLKTKKTEIEKRVWKKSLSLSLLAEFGPSAFLLSLLSVTAHSR
jgi:hypothetical protein